MCLGNWAATETPCQPWGLEGQDTGVQSGRGTSDQLPMPLHSCHPNCVVGGPHMVPWTGAESSLRGSLPRHPQSPEPYAGHRPRTLGRAPCPPEASTSRSNRQTQRPDKLLAQLTPKEEAAPNQSDGSRPPVKTRVWANTPG